jgi:hypothetical protein
MSDESSLIVPEPDVGSSVLPLIRDRSHVAIRRVKPTSVVQVVRKSLERVSEGR